MRRRRSRRAASICGFIIRALHCYHVYMLLNMVVWATAKFICDRRAHTHTANRSDVNELTLIAHRRSSSNSSSSHSNRMGIETIKHTGSTEFKFTIYKQMFFFCGRTRDQESIHRATSSSSSLWCVRRLLVLYPISFEWAKHRNQHSSCRTQSNHVVSCFVVAIAFK